jgi:HEAT repeat protein
MRWQVLILVIGVGLVIFACGTERAQPMSVEQLVIILETPDSENFARATQELGEMGEKAAPASLVLAKAMQYPRRDSYAAAQALIKIGPAAKGAIPELIRALENERVEVRSDAAIVLGVIGEEARCAVPYLALLLWDDLPEISSSAARAIDNITELDSGKR